MRKVTRESINAFLNRDTYYKSNTSVKDEQFKTLGGIYLKNTILYLHGNAIAKLTPNGKLYITNAGWSTNTTKERLNALPNVRINQKNFEWFLNGRAWNGEWTNPEEWDEQTKTINESKHNFLFKIN